MEVDSATSPPIARPPARVCLSAERRETKRDAKRDWERHTENESRSLKWGVRAAVTHRVQMPRISNVIERTQRIDADDRRDETSQVETRRDDTRNIVWVWSVLHSVLYCTVHFRADTPRVHIESTRKWMDTIHLITTRNMNGYNSFDNHYNSFVRYNSIQLDSTQHYTDSVGRPHILSWKAGYSFCDNAV